MSDLPELRPGDVVDGKYQIVSLLGEGGMGQVFKTRHIHLNTFRTIKVMRRNLLLDEANRNRFVREARLATLVHHQNVAVVHDFSSLGDGTHYMVSEFIEGITIRQWMRMHGRMPVALALRIALQTLSGLEHIHRAGLLHRDLSADNIMISSTEDGDPIAKIIDLGVAKQLVGATMSEATQVGLFIGNPRYSSPEQLGALSDAEELDGRADIYCFGIVLYEMLTGMAPFVSSTPQGYAIKHLTAAPPPFAVHGIGEQFPPGLETAVLRSLEKQRTGRFASAREFGLSLAPFASDVLPEVARMKVAALRADSTTLVTMRTTEIPSSYTPPPPGGEGEEVRAWQEAVTAANRAGFEEFLSRWPEGVHAEEGRARLAELDLVHAVERMAERGDVSGLDRLSQTHPPSTAAGRAVLSALEVARRRRAATQEEEWRDASASATREAFQRFLRIYTEGPGVGEARARIVELDAIDRVDEAARLGDASSLRRIADTWTPGQRAGEAARAALDRLQEESRRRNEAAEETAWQSAVREGSRHAMTRFLESHPDGLHALDARARIGEADLLSEIELLAASSDLGALRRHADTHGGSTAVGQSARAAIARLEDHSQRARTIALQDEAWNAAKADGGREHLERFVREMPDAPQVSQARSMLGELDLVDEIERLAEEGDLAGLKSMAASLPVQGRAGSAIRRAVERLADETRRRRVAEQEERDWNTALQGDSEESWNAYLSRQPESSRAGKARRMRDEAAHFEAALRSGGSNALRAFLQTWPESRFRPVAEQRLRSEDEERATHEYAAAVRADAADGYRQFLDEFPGSVHAAEAKKRWTLLTDLAHARKVDTAMVWREMLGRHPDEPRMAEARSRLQELESVQTRQLDAAISARNAAAARAALQGDISLASAELARRALDEVTALQSAVRASSSEAIRRFLRNHSGGHFETTAQFVLSKLEDAAFALLLQARSRELATRFLRDFPSSTKTPNVRRLLASLEESDAFEHAMREIRRGNLKPAEDGLLNIADLQLRNQLSVESERYRRSTPLKKLRAFCQYLLEWAGSQMRVESSRQPRYELTPAARELKTAREEILEDLKELAAVLKSSVARVAEPAAAPAAPVSAERALPPMPVAQRAPRAELPVAAAEPPRRRSRAAVAAFLVLLLAGFVGVLWRMMEPQQADKLIGRGRELARMVTLDPDQAKAARLLARNGQLQIDALPFARVTSVRGGEMEWISDTTWTPVRIAVPEGRYQITLVGPDGTTERSVAVDVHGREPQLVRVTFTPVDAGKYLSER